MLKEGARLAMAHMQALSMDITAHAERIAIGDHTPMSRAAATGSSAAFVQMGRCMRLTLAMKAHAKNPNAKPEDLACLTEAMPSLPRMPSFPGSMAPAHATEFKIPDLTQIFDTETLDRPEREFERESERDSWGAFPTLMGRVADARDAGDTVHNALGRILFARSNVLRRFEENPLSEPERQPKAKAEPGETGYDWGDTPPGPAPNGLPPHPIHNPGGYADYPSYLAAKHDWDEAQIINRITRERRDRRRRRPPKF